MAYRDVSESLRAYRGRVAADLDEARLAAKQVAEQAAKVTVLEKELAETDGLLAKMGAGPRKLPLLDSVTVAAPCTASWDEMVGDEHVRFCGQCEKNVYNLSSLPEEEAQALLVAREGSMCVRLFRRVDGTVLTSDCPVGKKRRRRRAAIAAVGGGLMAAAAAIGIEASQSGSTMGDVATTTSTTSTTSATAPVESTPTATGDFGHWTGGVMALPMPEQKPQVKPTPTPKALLQGRVQLKK